MPYRKFKADQLFTGYDLVNGVLVIDDEGRVCDIVEDAGEDVESFSGIITPGFINAHTHLELSHLKGSRQPGGGLISFLLDVVKMRDQIDGSARLRAMEEAENEMVKCGTVGVIDICNSESTLEFKSKSKIQWHNLIEVISPVDETSDERLAHYIQIMEKFKLVYPHSTGLTPHAPYSVSPSALKFINQNTSHQLVSIHNQESRYEDDLFLDGTGDYLNLFDALGYKQSPIAITGSTSLQSFLPYFNRSQTVLLVHNTFTSEDDIQFAQKFAPAHDVALAYCICPNANLFIENSLPPLDVLVKYDCYIVLGTDSYANNFQLNVAAEIQTIVKHFPSLPLSTILRWATSNPARMMNWNELGSFEKGKKPGVVLLNNEFEVKRLA